MLQPFLINRTKRFGPFALAACLLLSASIVFSADGPEDRPALENGAAQENDLGALFREAELEETGHRDLETAVRLYNRVIARAGAQDPWAAKAWLQIGRCYERLGHTADALAAFQKASLDESTREAAQNAIEGLRQKKTVTHAADTRYRRLRPWSSMTPFVQAEFYAAGSVFDFSPAKLAGYVSRAIPYDQGTLTGSSAVSGGTGLRIGAFFPLNDNGTEAGWSASYIKGPSATLALEHRLSSISYETAHGDYNTDYIRLLNELRHRVPLTKYTELRVRAALGIAFGEISGTTTRASHYLQFNSGMPYVYSSVLAGNDSWVGITGDLSPSIAIVTRNLSLDVGLTYALLPGRDSSIEGLSVKWNPIGLRISAEF